MPLVRHAPRAFLLPQKKTMNELLLILSVFFIFGAALLAYRCFGKAGLYCVSACATILANIEVVILIHAFGMDQTLGNVLFAVTFLITDILSDWQQTPLLPNDVVFAN